LQSEREILVYLLQGLSIKLAKMAMPPAASLKGTGVPVKLLHEAEGHVVTVSLLFSYIHHSPRTLYTIEITSHPTSHPYITSKDNQLQSHHLPPPFHRSNSKQEKYTEENSTKQKTTGTSNYQTSLLQLAMAKLVTWNIFSLEAAGFDLSLFLTC
jgi:hypothetical protein